MEKKEVFLPDGVCGKAGTIKAFKYKTRNSQTAGSAEFEKTCLMYLPFGYKELKHPNGIVSSAVLHGRSLHLVRL